MSSDASSILGATCPVPITETPRILLGHGSGGRLTAKLVDEIILPAFRNPLLEPLDDAAIISPGAGRIAFTTDSYVVTPIFFPGGDIGDLAVNGTVNDLAVSGARPIALSLAFILEEGFPIHELERVIGSIRRAAAAADVSVATGDTKVVGRGCADKIFINTSGVGVVPEGVDVSARRVRAGDAVLLSGTVGDHGVAILSRREGLEFGGEIVSDTAPLNGLITALLGACKEVHAMRDPTRGGVASTLVEIATRQNLGIEIDETRVPLHDAVRGACEMLGLDPLLVANEGKVVAFVPEHRADAALAAMRAHPLGREAVRIGRVTSDHPGTVWVRTPIGGARVLELPFAEMLPRI
jgi:hydrogenase expression/formation protein HypE